MSTTPSPNPFRDHWAESLRLRREASEGSLDAMRVLAERQDPVYRDAFREACRDVLGEDPDDLYYVDSAWDFESGNPREGW